LAQAVAAVLIWEDEDAVEKEEPKVVKEESNEAEETPSKERAACARFDAC
jgi:hypothetical protein